MQLDVWREGQGGQHVPEGWWDYHFSHPLGGGGAAPRIGTPSPCSYQYGVPGVLGERFRLGEGGAGFRGGRIFPVFFPSITCLRISFRVSGFVFPVAAGSTTNCSPAAGGQTGRLFSLNFSDMHAIAGWQAVQRWALASATVDLEGLPTSKKINAERLQYRFWALNSRQWEEAVQQGFADFPDVSPLQLERLDRGGAIIKALALLQVTYLVARLIARKVGGLPSTQLEIATLAFAASSFVAYILYWGRPQGIGTIHAVNPRDATPSTPRPGVAEPAHVVNGQFPDWARRTDELAKVGPTYLWLGYRTPVIFNQACGPVPIPNDGVHPTPFPNLPCLNRFSEFFRLNDESVMMVFGSVIGGVLFGGLHCLAWNSPFPTIVEQVAWRVCSILTTALPVVASIPLSVWVKLHLWEKDDGSQAGQELLAAEESAGRTQKDRKNLDRMRGVVGAVLLLCFIAPYVLARLFIMVEMFRSLGYLPPEAFIQTWSGSFPHFG